MTTAQCKRQGFDQSRTEDGYIILKCSRCEACFINSTPCHEPGCLNLAACVNVVLYDRLCKAGSVGTQSARDRDAYRAALTARIGATHCPDCKQVLTAGHYPVCRHYKTERELLRAVEKEA